MVDNYKVAPPSREMKTDMEALIRTSSCSRKVTACPPAGYARSRHKGEFGCYLVSDGANKPFRVPARPASHLSSMDEIVKRHCCRTWWR